MSKYAADTSVAADKSRSEIEATLRRYGADEFGYLTTRDAAVVMFAVGDRRIKFTLPMPDPHAIEFTHTPEKRLKRSDSQREAAWEQATRQRWRALALVIKAKLEAVESGITEFDDEFLAHILTPGGATIGEQLRPQLAGLAQGNRIQLSLGAGS
jgi:hypothetical protein